MTGTKERTSGKPAPRGETRIFSDLAEFSRAVQSDAGVDFDFASVIELTTDFVASSEKYLILNLKDYNGDEPNNLLFLTEENTFLYTRNPPAREALREFERLYYRPFGRSTVLAFATINKVLESYKRRLEGFIAQIRELEEVFDSRKYRDLTSEFERLHDRLEDLNDMLLRLQERGYRQIQTRYISFDYSVLLAEAQSLQDRTMRRLNMLKEIARDNETRVATELNKRIERLNDVVKRLTALTVLLMVPTLIASHFGMNFMYMPELRVWWAYPATIAAQVGLVIAGLIVFRKIGWL